MLKRKVITALGRCVHLVVDGGTLEQCAAKTGQLVHRIQSRDYDCDVGLNERFPQGKMMHYFSLFCADCEGEDCAGGRELVNAALLVSL